MASRDRLHSGQLALSSVSCLAPSMRLRPVRPHKSSRGSIMTTASRALVKRNIGFDPIDTPAPDRTFALAAAASPQSELDDLQREIIEFDSEGPEGAALFAFSTAT